VSPSNGFQGKAPSGGLCKTPTHQSLRTTCPPTCPPGLSVRRRPSTVDANEGACDGASCSNQTSCSKMRRTSPTQSWTVRDRAGQSESELKSEESAERMHGLELVGDRVAGRAVKRRFSREEIGRRHPMQNVGLFPMPLSIGGKGRRLDSSFR
jgi:hypothetical protein